MALAILGTRHDTLSELQQKGARRLIWYKRHIRCAFRRSTGQALPIFVMGYGRSGTTMMLNTFALDERFDIRGENDPRIAKDFMLIYEKLSREITLCRLEALVAKPILNSFDAASILQRYQRAKIVWMLRDYRDVCASSVKRFGSTVGGYLKELVTTGGGDNWMARGMQGESVKVLRQLKWGAFSDYDWMGLVWWSVNRTIILDHLYDHSRFRLVKYEDLVTNPELTLEQLYGFFGLEHKRGLGRFIHNMSVGRGSSLQLHETIRTMCDELNDELSAFCHLVR